MVTSKNLILTGSPGVGKTTLIKECTLRYQGQIGGFFTEEIKEGSTRSGFLLKTYSGASGILAKKGLPSPHRLNKYGVDVRVLDEVGVSAIEAAMDQHQVVVVDEIGAMEIMSPLFCEIIAKVLSHPVPCLATIRLKAEPFFSQVRKMSDTKVIHLTRDNINTVKKEIQSWLKTKIPA